MLMGVISYCGSTFHPRPIDPTDRPIDQTKAQKRSINWPPAPLACGSIVFWIDPSIDLDRDQLGTTLLRSLDVVNHSAMNCKPVSWQTEYKRLLIVSEWVAVFDGSPRG
jgi:hypothetical protein